ncbi:MAG TPA: glycosyltransferase family 4 protein, partial [Ktedonobacterales bacterium]|nr:glycosyltransferase family 4 protein [Ktedonobacterales bacterium]
DSHTSARLVAQVSQALGFDPAIDAQACHLTMLHEVYEHAGDFDIIHSHLDYLTLPFIALTPTPTVITLHGRLDVPAYQRLFPKYPHANLVAISDSQRSEIPDAHWVATIHHSVDIESFPFSPIPGKYLLFVGRVAPEKGTERAIEIAIAADIPLKIAAKVDQKDKNYFEERVRPMLDHHLIEFIGPVDEKEKRLLMRDALALLAPIEWPEPFGMVFIESLACGTPVLTCPNGSAPELLRDGVTGYMYETNEELVAAAHKVGALSRTGCRAYAMRRWNLRRMAQEYERVYMQLLQQTPAWKHPRRRSKGGARQRVRAKISPLSLLSHSEDEVARQADAAG